jgi:hypothetical protein
MISFSINFYQLWEAISFEPEQILTDGLHCCKDLEKGYVQLVGSGRKPYVRSRFEADSVRR